MAQDTDGGASGADRDGSPGRDGAVGISDFVNGGEPLYGDSRLIEDDDGTLHRVSVDGIVTVLPDGESKIFLRNAMKVSAADGKPKGHVRVVVAELDGVRAYVLGNRVILTRQDLNF